MKELEFLLKKNSNSLSEIPDVFERISANFANLIKLLLQIKIEVSGDSIWSTSSNFEMRVVGKFAINRKPNRLIIKVGEFNPSIDRHRELMII